MSVAKRLLAEFETQSTITRRFLERLPPDELTWKPHAKSMTAGQLGYHLAVVPKGVVQSARQLSNPVPTFVLPPQPESVTRSSPRMMTAWLRCASYSAMPRGEFLRNIMLNHWYQHRGQLAVYLRLSNVPVPASRGPSADKPAFVTAAAPAQV
jgi:hypothetical protein